MRSVLYSLLFLSTIGLLEGCRKDSPKAVAATWLNCFWKLDFDCAENVSTEQTQNLLHTFERLASIKGDSLKQKSKDITISIKTETDSGNTAVVTYTTSDNPNKLQVINLVKEEEKWLVQFSKRDQMIGGYTAPAGDAQEMDSTIQNGATIEVGTPDTSAARK